MFCATNCRASSTLPGRNKHFLRACFGQSTLKEEETFVVFFLNWHTKRTSLCLRWKGKTHFPDSQAVFAVNTRWMRFLFQRLYCYWWQFFLKVFQKKLPFYCWNSFRRHLRSVTTEQINAKANANQFCKQTPWQGAQFHQPAEHSQNTLTLSRVLCCCQSRPTAQM